MSQHPLSGYGARQTWEAINGQVQSGKDEEYVREPAEEPDERLERLNYFWRFWRVEEYADRKTKWNGDPYISPSQINRPNQLPANFEEAGASTPLDQRVPTAPVGLVRTIINRFTGLLFSTGRSPQLSVPADPDTEDFLKAMVDETGFWGKMVHARNLGGAMGAVAVGFKIVNGHIVIDVIDPRYCTVEYMDHDQRELKYLQVQYKYQKHVHDAPMHMESKDPQGDPDEDTLEEHAISTSSKKWYWYRRLVTRSVDIVWEDIPCTSKEPEWHKLPRKRKHHAMGFVPYVYISNIPTGDGVDGDPDCLGVYGLSTAVDALIAQAHYGTISNSDPTLAISTPDPDGVPPVIRKGSDNALIMGTGSNATYLELGGQSLRSAMDMAKELEERAYRLAQCVPESAMLNNQGDKTATEIERTFSAMLEKADALRVQYGQGITRLMQKILAATRMLHTPKTDPLTGALYIERVSLPPRIDYSEDGEVMEIPRTPGRGQHIKLLWGKYFSPTLNDIETAIRLATMAKDSEVLSKRDCIAYFSTYLGMDPQHIMKELEREKKETEKEEAESEEGGDEVPEPMPPQKPSDAMVLQGLITINEYRMSLGLGPIPGGDMTLPQYRASNPDMFLASELPTSKAMIDKVVAQQGAQQGPDSPPMGGVPMGPGDAPADPSQPVEERPADMQPEPTDAPPDEEPPL